MNDAIGQLIENVAAQGLLGRFKPGDTLVLDDNVLQAAIERRHPLNRSEYAALLASPLTLRRLQKLAASRQAGVSGVTAATAANDDFWSGSQCILRAADSGAQAPSLTTADGWWLLAFLAAGQACQMVLKLDEQAPFADALIRSGRQIVVRDGQGQVLLHGSLDQDGELEAPWPFAMAPYAHLLAAGGKISVEQG